MKMRIAIAAIMISSPAVAGSWDCWAGFKQEYDRLAELHKRAVSNARQAALDGHSAAAQIYGNTAMELMREAAAVRLAALQKCQ